MNKRLIAVLSILLFFLSIPLVPAHAAVKAGGACKKAGITSVVLGKTYTCIKSGKKLVWGSGKTIVPKIVIKSQTTLGKLEFGGVAISDDGSKLIISESCTKRNSKGSCEAFGNIYTSSDYGLTWLKQEDAGSRYWKGVTSSSDGRILHAVSYPGDIYRSEDFGFTWRKMTCCNRAWWTISSSADGEKLVAAENVIPKGVIATSNDAGKTWTDSLNAGKKIWADVTSSSDGSKLAVVGDGYIYTSGDFGINWTENISAGKKSWSSIDISNDGQTIVASAEDSNIVISNDSGITWNSVLTLQDKNWNSVAISGDGMKVFALGDYGAALYYSEDSGKTWKKWNYLINPGNSDLVVSNDGTRMFSIPTPPSQGYLNSYAIN